MNIRDIWIFLWISSIVLNKYNMADLDLSSSDSENEFSGFTAADIENTSVGHVQFLQSIQIFLILGRVMEKMVMKLLRHQSGHIILGRLKLNLLFRKEALFYLMILILLDGTLLIISTYCLSCRCLPKS